MNEPEKEETWEEEYDETMRPYLGSREGTEASKQFICTLLDRVRTQERYCCKYQTVDPNNFCDECLKIINKV